METIYKPLYTVELNGQTLFYADERKDAKAFAEMIKELGKVKIVKH